MPLIIEIPVYDGRYKHWRILNLTTGSVYSSEFKEEIDAFAAIQMGTERNGSTVVGVQRDSAGRAIEQWIKHPT